MTEFTLKKPIRVLCLEDNNDDRELLAATLAAEGLTCNLVHAKTRQEFEAALGQSAFDLIISDFSLPSYDGMTALATAQKVQKQTPFIFVSGTIGEERAVESLKNGATDYVLKDRRERLVPAVRRALRDSQERIERKQLEDQLRQSQKMEAVGQLAGGVAHDFNNLLAVIQGNAELALITGKTLGDEVQDNLTQIIAASKQAANLTRQLLTFSRKQAMQPRPVNLIDLIKNLTKMLRRVIGADIHLASIHSRHAPVVQADMGMIEQVLLNLVVNSRDAMPNGGELVISTKRLRVCSKYLRFHADASAGEFVCLKVRDTGCGIAPEHMPRIFEPFFTTKEVGKGTGLGLATVYGIVKQHGGWIRVSSRPGQGTVFRIFLPAIEPSGTDNGSLDVVPVGRNGSERILLVEDDASVRTATRRLLRAFGYQVIEAGSGPEALEIWRKQEASIDLLLTDIVMPGGMNGCDLAVELRKHRPLLKVIFVSGYSFNMVGKYTDILQQENTHFLKKPCPANVLADTIRRCLDETRAASC